MLLSKQKIAESFDGAEATTIWPRQSVLKFIEENRHGWKMEDGAPDCIRIASSASSTQILNAVVRETSLQSVKLAFPYRSVTRFVWGNAPTYSIIQSVDQQGYFSHYTAMQVHNLTDQIPKAAYFNVEQPATGGGGSLSQAGIDRAFKGRCRVTNNVLEFRGMTIHKINGQNTERLGVTQAQMKDGADIFVTDIERTLIDIAVRPIYSGGISEVAGAYREAAERVSGNRLATYLKSLNYTYPYHQAIGYYMEKAGNYTESQMKRIKAIPREFDFYINYQIKNPALNEGWRLFIPKGF
ncbi:hypothetical protein Mal64_09140 [Pseudobythopirellula maris]|uniref:AbiEi antitoxin C-terminal domain-containing protein n=1 Tax=Pseudobythopirellula maris TaxID=2527991 RepID=A0A5C5ZW87_9BACT|nr:hypothetical protein [Pseudobythopirellula maris]TWT90523.1 hypothetical protein Mal64_09140 [Pseudobythopirellula maris]